MAGGSGRRGAPLHARTRVGGPPGTAQPAPSATPCPARHCWVTAPVDGGAPRPGLLLEWRRGERGWEARVAYAAELRTGRWGTVEEWLPADVVAPGDREVAPGRPLGSAP